MTGVLPHNHGMVRNNHVTESFRTELQDGVDTWSRRLSSEGYYLGYIGKWHVERSRAFDQFGFDEYEVPGSEEYQQNFVEHRKERGLTPQTGRLPENLTHSYTVSQTGYEDQLLYGTHAEPEGTPAHYNYSRGIDFVRDASNRSDPWCLTVSTRAPHDPFLTPEGAYDRYDPNSIPKPENFHDPTQDKPELYLRISQVWDDLSWEQYAEAIAHYYAYCTHIDEQVGRIRDALAETRQLDNTIVIFTSDHGDMMGGHRLFTHGFTAFEELYHSPLVIRWPGVGKTGHTCGKIVQLHELAPTIVEMGGGSDFPPERNTASKHPRSRADEDTYQSYTVQSLVPFLSGERPVDYKPEAYAEFEGDSAGITQRIYWNERYKYVYNMFACDELYNLQTDPGEIMNLVDDSRHRDTKMELADRMWEIARDTGDCTITTNHYWMNRIAPVGPQGTDE